MATAVKPYGGGRNGRAQGGCCTRCEMDHGVHPFPCCCLLLRCTEREPSTRRRCRIVGEPRFDVRWTSFGSYTRASELARSARVRARDARCRRARNTDTGTGPGARDVESSTPLTSRRGVSVGRIMMEIVRRGAGSEMSPLSGGWIWPSLLVRVSPSCRAAAAVRVCGGIPLLRLARLMYKV